jgi:hypothetical protein
MMALEVFFWILQERFPKPPDFLKGNMAKLIPAAERLIRARKLIQKARDLPVPDRMGKRDFSYIANIKDLLRQARDMVKFISMTPTATAEMKEEVKRIYREIEQADEEILK